MKKIILLIMAGTLMAGNTALAGPGSGSVPAKSDQPYECEEDLIEVMFIQESQVRMRNGVLADFRTNAMEGIDNILRALPWYNWHRIADVPETTMDAWEVKGELNTGQDLYNLNNIYRLRIPRGYDVWELAESLEALPGIYLARPVPRPVPAPSPPNYQSQQGYLYPAATIPSGIDALWAWTQTGGTGAGITVCDLEYSWNYNHADITKALGSQINTNPISDPFSNNNHGTAVIGQLVADNNGWGTTGICYGANLKTCATYYNSSWNVPGAIAIAIAALSAGDIIVLEQQWDYTGSSGYVPVEWWLNYSPNPQTNNGVYAAIATAVANGIHVVEAGGNGAINTGTMTWFGNSGAIVVGAGGATVTNNLQKLSFSSYGPRFDLQGWGENVVTTGYGDLYNSLGANYYYTSSFSGTSSSSPIVAGALACAEGYYLANISAIPPTPAYMRTQLITYGTTQVTPPAGNIGPRPDIKKTIQNFPVNLLDFGDAPDQPYPTLLASVGANHAIDGITFLGLLIDAEPDGQPSVWADLDDLTGFDDEDGVVFLNAWLPGQPANISVTASVQGFLNLWVDFNGNGTWADPGEHVFTDQYLPPGTTPLSFNVPITVYTGPNYMRFRFCTQQGLNFFGPAPDGEVEDYVTYVEPAYPNDWGDAPDPTYPTLNASMGANHVIDWVTFMGIQIDGEPDGLPSPLADGDDLNGSDDEDGLLFSYPWIPGQQARLTVTVSAPGFFNGWIDFNKNGFWGDPGEQVFTDVPLAGTGPIPQSFIVPASVSPGSTFARFRFSTMQGLTFMGPAPNGEVEDYMVIFDESPDQLDWGDAPDPTYPTLNVSMGANHLIDWVTFLGLLIDAELNGQPSAMADLDDLTGVDDEDGVVFLNGWIAGQPANLQVTASVNGFLNLWVDFNGNGTWADPGDHVFMDLPLMPGLNPLSFNIPVGTPSGPKYMRFRFCTMQGLSYTGNAPNGEVEDYVMNIEPEPDQLDWGDAPDPTYPTLNASMGANHLIDWVTYLGAQIDAEVDGIPTLAADGDDITGVDDEDGVVFMWPIVKGNPCKIQVTASVGTGLFSMWIDFNGDGDWADANEQVFADLNLMAGPNYLTFITPRNITIGSTYTRCRFSHQPGLSFTGSASDGEVEDYKVPIEGYGESKWIQPPDPLFPGLHATTPNQLADDWICNGEVVTDLHWWGNYELNPQGVEKRGAGISHFQVMIYDNQNCLPNNLLKSYIVSFSPMLEINTGLLNNEGSPIYRYDFMLPDPFIQVRDTTYWLSVIAVPNDPTNAPSWRWQEANRWYYPILCGAAYVNVSGAWQTITWSGGTSMLKYSDLAFDITSWVVDTLYLQNITVSSPQVACYDATNVLIVAGNSTTFTVDPGASATMIAGLKIIYRPGTHAKNGSYMHGYITSPTGPFCPRLPVMTGISIENKEVIVPGINTSSGLKAYPNPTNGKLTIMPPETENLGSTFVEVSGLMGQPVLKQRFEPLAPVEIDLALQPPGIYILRVTHENQIHVVKIIRQ